MKTESLRNRALCAIAVLVLLRSGAPAQVRKAHSQRAIEVASVRLDGIELRFRNIWKSPVSIGMCDEPRRLSGVAFELQRSERGKWKAIHPEGVVLGDLPPKFVQVDVGKSMLVPVRFSPTFMGISKGETIRVLVTVWHTETSLVTGTLISDGQAPSFRIASEPIHFLPASSQR